MIKSRNLCLPKIVYAVIMGLTFAALVSRLILKKSISRAVVLAHYQEERVGSNE